MFEMTLLFSITNEFDLLPPLARFNTNFSLKWGCFVPSDVKDWKQQQGDDTLFDLWESWSLYDLCV